MKRALSAVVAAALLVAMAGCTGTGAGTAGGKEPGGPAMGMAVPPDVAAATMQAYPEAVQSKLQEMQDREATGTVTVGDDIYVIITAGEKPGAAVPVLSTERNGDAIEVVYAIEELTGIVSVTPTVTRPYNVVVLEGAAGSAVTFRKAAPSQG